MAYSLSGYITGEFLSLYQDTVAYLANKDLSENEKSLTKFIF